MKKSIIISSVNVKGGSAKTSTVLNLGGVLCENGRRPLLIDSDPQQSATRWAQQGAEQFPFPVVPLDIGKNIKNLKDSLDNIVKQHNADIVLFDTPPQLEDEALLAVLLSDLVLIPITPSPLDLWAGEKALEIVKEARKERKNGLPRAVIIPSRLIPNTVLAREIKGTLKQFNESIAPSITMRVAMVEASVAGLPIHMYAPGSPSHKEFQALAKFITSKSL